MNYKLHYCSRAKTEPVLLTIIQDTKIKPPDFVNANFILIFHFPLFYTSPNFRIVIKKPDTRISKHYRACNTLYLSSGIVRATETLYIQIKLIG